jgi:deoxyribonuclease V
VRFEGWDGRLRKVLALDVAYKGDSAAAAAVLWDNGRGGMVAHNIYRGSAAFPYVPGYLFIREAPLMLAAARPLRGEFDVALVDGHGYAHPRRAGLAVFIGLLLDSPTIGIAKSLLTGRVREGGGRHRPIVIGRETVGLAFHWPEGVFYASPGNKLSVDDISVIMTKLGGYPAALREAHRMAREALIDKEPPR